MALLSHHGATFAALVTLPRSRVRFLGWVMHVFGYTVILILLSASQIEHVGLASH